RLVERGAEANLWQARALGLIDCVQAFVQKSTGPARDEITKAFWCACHEGQEESAGPFSIEVPTSTGSGWRAEATGCRASKRCGGPRTLAGSARHAAAIR